VFGRPLPNRLHVVVSRGEPAVFARRARGSSLGAALASSPRSHIEHTFLVSGAGLLASVLAHPEPRYIYLTRVDATFDSTVP
jgi:dihydrofolate reductase